MITRDGNPLQTSQLEKWESWYSNRRSLEEIAVRLTTFRWDTLALLLMAIAGCNAPSPSGSAPEVAPEAVSERELPDDEVILQTVLDQTEEQNFCDGFYQPEVAAESQVYRTGDRALVELQCARAAYQSVYAFVALQPDGTVQSLPLEVFYPDESGQFERTSETTVGGLASFDPETSVLTVFSKARGLGDCGSLAEYRWTGDALELATFRYQACGDSPEESIDPADFPQVYP